jgi:raffinose/stachyose/melibiose transport system permease protein
MKLLMTKNLFRSILIINVLTVLLPIFFLFNSALRETNDFARNPLVLARHPYWQNFSDVWADGNFAVYLKNSIIVTGGSLLLILAILPLFIQLKWMHLLNSHIGLILVYTAGALPAAIFIMSGFFRALPLDLDNAARIDGASEGQLLRKVLVPLVKPGLAIIAIYSAIPIWNDFFLPLVFLQDPSKKTIMQGLTAFFGEYQSQWGALFAGLTMAALPLIVLYLLLSEQFIKGLTAGAVKG